MLTRSYDRPLLTTYSFAVTISATQTFGIQMPVGATAFRVEDLQVSVTTTYNAVTTPAHVELGIVGTLTKYIDLTMGTAAAGVGYGLRDQPTAVKADAGFGAPLKGVELGPRGENLTQLVLTTVPSTGGTPAGAGVVHLTLAWW